VAPWVTQAVNDKQHVVPMLARLQALPADLIEVLLDWYHRITSWPDRPSMSLRGTGQ
jgi:hypothetical protein